MLALSYYMLVEAKDLRAGVVRMFATSRREQITRVLDGARKGLRLTFSDQGPGIDDVAKALTDGYSTGGGLGLGLSGARRLSNEFSIDSAPGQGTRRSARSA